MRRAFRSGASALTETVVLVSIVLFFTWTGQSEAQTTVASGPGDPEELELFLDEFFSDYMERLHVPGAVFVLVKDGSIFLSKGYGVADVERQTPVIPDETLFRIGSISKLFTATAVMQLYEQHKLNLDDDVNRYLEQFQLESSYPEPVTFAGLLTHTGGFDDRNIYQVALSEHDLSPLGRYLARRMPPRVMPPGDVTSYSNHGAALAGYLVERIAGVPFSDYVDGNIFRLLDMHMSSFGLPSHLEPHLATGYVFRKGEYRQVPVEFFNIAPACAMSATATDMAHFMIAHLGGGRYGDSRILRDETVREMHAQQFTNHASLPGFAFGFYEKQINQQRVITHTGAISGFYSLLLLLPEQDLGLFVSSNNFGFGIEGKLLPELQKRFFDRYYPGPNESPGLVPTPGTFGRRDSLAGKYRFNRYARHTMDKYTVLIGKVRELKVTENADGTLTVKPGRKTYIEVEPLVFQDAETGDQIAFREGPDNRVTHMFKGPWAFERLPWYDTMLFQRALMGTCYLILLSGLVVWSVGVFLARLKRRPAGKRSPRLARVLAGVVSGLQLVFMTGLALTLPRDPLVIWRGVPLTVAVLLVLPLLAAVLTFGLLVFSALAWKEKYWGITERLHYSIVTLAAVILIPVWLHWNLLGFHF